MEGYWEVESSTATLTNAVKFSLVCFGFATTVPAQKLNRGRGKKGSQVIEFGGSAASGHRKG